MKRKQSLLLVALMAGTLVLSVDSAHAQVPTTCQGQPVTISGSNFDDANI